MAWPDLRWARTSSKPASLQQLQLPLLRQELQPPQRTSRPLQPCIPHLSQVPPRSCSTYHPDQSPPWCRFQSPHKSARSRQAGCPRPGRSGQKSWGAGWLWASTCRKSRQIWSLRRRRWRLRRWSRRGNHIRCRRWGSRPRSGAGGGTPRRIGTPGRSGACTRSWRGAGGPGKGCRGAPPADRRTPDRGRNSGKPWRRSCSG